jgi:nucleoid-associated protein YgaU
MKSSTIRRSTLSKESMEVIENLAKEQDSQDGLGEYVRPNDIASETEKSSKAQEIDLLWQTFKSTQFTTNSPTAYILLGVGIGVVVTLLVLGTMSFFMNKSAIDDGSKASLFGVEKVFSGKKEAPQTIDEQVEDVQSTKNSVSVPDEDGETSQVSDNSSVEKTQNFDSSKMKKYVIKDGDTVEGIIKKHYGTYSQEKADLIMKANNLKTLDRINVDQELLIPLE